MHRNHFLILLLSVVYGTTSSYSQSSLEFKADSILKLMTLQEKVGQLNMVAGFWGATGPESSNENKIELIQSGKVGAMLNVRGFKKTFDMQTLAMRSRLKIPMLFGLDVIHGYRTIFPIPLAQAASFDTAQIRYSSHIAAKESLASGLHWLFSPMLDVSRDPRWGRVMEGPGEDPFLASAIARSVVQGYQQPQDGLQLMACVKHFAAYGAAIGGRDYNTVDISDQTLYNVYLPPFKSAVEAGAESLMCSFNEINGVPATANPKLYSILFNDWKFKGLVVSDWGSIHEMVVHGYSKDRDEASIQALTTGVDIDMESHSYIKRLEKLVNEKKIEVSSIDRAVKKVLMQKLRLGLFDDPFKYCNESNERSDILTDENRKASRIMARKSIVLLKNDHDVLPFKNPRRIAIIGPLGDSKRDMDGNWVPVGEKLAVTLLEAVKMQFPGTEVLFEKGCEVSEADRSGFERAKKIAKNADVVILALGESWTMSGEARSRGSLSLPGVQEELAEAIYSVNKNSVTLVMGGRPLIFNSVAEKAPAILYCWWLGTEAGNAIVDVLWGKYNPSARLPMSFPKDVGQIPVYYNHKNSGRPPKESNFSNRYIDIDYKPRYPFGYGLSYTNFEYGNIDIQTNRNNILLTTDIKNSGKMAGSELVQVYIRKCWGEVTSPVKELKGFRQQYLKPGEKVKVEIAIAYADLEYYGVDGWRKPEGDYEIMLGKSADSIFYKKGFTIPGNW